MPDNQTTPWRDEELQAAVETYIDMRQKQWTGEPLNKKACYQTLAERFGHTDKAFEYRMQNISHVYQQMGRAWLKGLPPAKNIGADIHQRIKTIIDTLDPLTTAEQFEQEVITLRQAQRQAAPKQMPPPGVKNPTRIRAAVNQIARSPAVQAWLLENANGHCECCQSPAPFLDAHGEPYLEIHHMCRLADDGEDTVENAIAVCPNCHRALHYSQQAKTLADSVYTRIERLARQASM